MRYLSGVLALGMLWGADWFLWTESHPIVPFVLTCLNVSLSVLLTLNAYPSALGGETDT